MTAAPRYPVIREGYFQVEETLLHACETQHMSDALSAAIERQEAERAALLDVCVKGLNEAHNNVTSAPTVEWTRKSLSKAAQLLIEERRLIPPTDPSGPAVGDAVRLASTMEGLKARPNLSQKQARFLQDMEKELRSAFIEKRDLRLICDALSLKLSEELESQTVKQDALNHANAVNDLQPDLVNCEHLLEVATSNGDMALAEDIAQNQILLLEKLLEVTEEQLPLLRARREEAKEYMRRRRWNIFRMANKDINGVIEMKYRQIEACQEDSTKLHTLVDQKAKEDSQSKDSYIEAISESDAFLENTARQQTEAFDHMKRLLEEARQVEQQMAALGAARNAEVKRRVNLMESEAARSAEYLSFIRTANEYFDLLSNAALNAEHVRDICRSFNDFLLDGCDNITLKFEKSEAELSTQMLLTSKEYLRLFGEYAVCVGRQKHRKDAKCKNVRGQQRESEMLLEFASDTFDPIGKRFSENREECQAQCEQLSKEVTELTAKLERLKRRFEPVAKLLRDCGIPFIHPMDLTAKANCERQERILEYKEVMNVTERKVELQIEQDAHEIHKDMEEHRFYLSQKQAATHKRHVEQATARAPKPPRSQTERAQALSFSRYQQLVKQLHPVQPAALPSKAPKLPPQPSKNTLLDILPKVSGRLEGMCVLAIFSYKARQPDEVSFSKGDRIVVIGEGPEAGWYRGVCNQRTGLFPLNYVTLAIEDDLLGID